MSNQIHEDDTIKVSFVNFTYSRVSHLMLRDERVGPYEILAVVALGMHTDNETGIAYPSVKRLAGHVKISVNRMRKSLQKLCDIGYLDIERQQDEEKPGRNKPNIYKLYLFHKSSVEATPQTAVPDDGVPHEVEHPTPHGGVPLPHEVETNYIHSNYPHRTIINSETEKPAKQEDAKERLALDKLTSQILSFRMKLTLKREAANEYERGAFKDIAAQMEKYGALTQSQIDFVYRKTVELPESLEAEIKADIAREKAQEAI